MQLEHEGPFVLPGKTPTKYIVIPYVGSNRSRRRTGKPDRVTHQLVRSHSDDAIKPPYRPTSAVIRSMTRSKYVPHVGKKQRVKLTPATV